MEAYLKKTKLAFVFVVCKFFVLLLTRSMNKIQYVVALRLQPSFSAKTLRLQTCNSATFHV